MGYNDTDPIVSFNRTAGTSSGTSVAVDMGATTLCGVIVSTNTHQGTSISFTVSNLSTGTYYAVVTSSGGPVVLNVSTQTAQYYPVNPVYFLGAGHLKLVSSSTQEATIYTLAVRPYSV